MQAGRDAGDADVGRVPLHGGDELVAAPPVGQPGAANLAVVAAGANELGQRELVDAARAAVRQVLGGDDLVDQPGRDHQPAQSQTGGEALAGGAAVGDVLGGKGLQG